MCSFSIGKKKSEIDPSGHTPSKTHNMNLDSFFYQIVVASSLKKCVSHSKEKLKNVLKVGQSQKVYYFGSNFKNNEHYPPKGKMLRVMILYPFLEI